MRNVTRRMEDNRIHGRGCVLHDISGFLVILEACK